MLLPDHLLIKGTVSCHEGRVDIRLYEGEVQNRHYLGTATGTILNHEFYAVASGIQKPASLSIELEISSPCDSNAGS